MEYRSQPLGKSRNFHARALVCVAVIGVVFTLLIGRTAWLTIVRGEDHAAAAQSNLVRNTRVDAPRGNIRDREGRPVATNRRAYSISFSPYRRTETEVHETLRRLSTLLGEDLLARKDEIIETRPTWTRHSLARRLSLAEVVPIMERPEDFPGVRLEDDFTREYSFGPHMAHVLGFMGRITAEDVHLYQRPIYLPDDHVGRAGVESRYEEQLVGKPGRTRAARDAAGRLLEEPVVAERARAGDDLVLSVDAELQRRAINHLGDETGSVVIVDITNGDVLVLASTPMFDPLAPGRSELNGREVSFLNRAYRGGYPPASTFKIVTASAALRNGHDPNERIACNGRWNWPGWIHPYHCNVRTGHGPLDMVGSLQRSCNVYTYQTAYDVGAERLMEEAIAFGYASATGIDLPGERSGQLQHRGTPPRGGEIMNFSIGQGAILATPLQVALSYAALTPRGEIPRPRVVSAYYPEGLDRRVDVEPVVERRVEMSSRDRNVILEGLRRVIYEPGGTGYREGFPRHWDLAGKSGTAENGRGGRDAWFVTMFPLASPRYVAVVHIEDAEAGGGEAAGPIMKAVLMDFFGEADPLPDELAATR